MKRNGTKIADATGNRSFMNCIGISGTVQSRMRYAEDRKGDRALFLPAIRMRKRVTACQKTSEK